jgi:replicative DNA helicase
MSEKVYYHDDEIEYSIIGYLMILVDKLDEVNGFSKVQALSMIPCDDCFYNTQYRDMFSAIKKGVEEGLLLTRDMFRKLEMKIDYDFFVNNNSLNLDYREYVSSLIRLWQLRQIVLLFNDANKTIKNTYSASDAFIKAHDTYTELKNVISIIEDANGVDVLAGKVCDDAMSANNSNRIIKTHIQKIDGNIHLRRGSLYLLSGKAKSGKTTLALNMVRSFCKNAIANKRDDRVVFVTLEMSAEDLMRKLIAMESGIPELAIYSGTAHNKSGILKASEEIAQWNLDIIEGIGLKISDVYAKLIPIIEQKKVSFVVVDHFTALGIDENAKSEIERNEIKSAKLGNLVKSLNLCMILIAHQKKSGQRYDKKEDEYDAPREEDIAGYGALEKWIAGQWVVFRKKDAMYDNSVFLYHFWWRYCRPLEECVELVSDMRTGYIGD